jgi:transcriptional regulator with XRE-family HTH domain
MVTQPQKPTQVIAARVKELRRKRGMSAAQLGDRLRDVGINWDRAILANLENGRRASVSVEELFGLALVLDVAPLHLVVPPVDGEGKPYAVTPTVTQPAGRVRSWVAGRHPIPGVDAATFMRERPRAPWKPSDREKVEVVTPIAPALARMATRPADAAELFEAIHWFDDEEERS